MTPSRIVDADEEGIALWNWHPELLAAPVPRYTSYPTAAEFSEGVAAPDLEEALDSVAPETEISLYIHIPYCDQICFYCGCNTGAANREKRLASYLEALMAEIGMVADRLQGRGRIIRVAFGGGSPNAISPEDFLRLTELLRSSFRTEDASLSVELDPRSLREEWFAALADAGADRASLGVQTLAPHVQEAIGRIQPEAVVGEAVEKLRLAGIKSLNFDLMYGLPNQTIGDLAETLSTVTRLAPDRIAFFGYAHVPDLIPRQRRISSDDLPTAEGRFSQAAFGRGFLISAGWEAVGFDHFALPDDELAAAARAGELRRNFQGFTEDRARILLGLGASAISEFPDRILQNEKNAGRYRTAVAAGHLPIRRGIYRSEDDKRRAEIIRTLLCGGEADLSHLNDRQRITDSLLIFEERALVEREGWAVRIQPDAWAYSRVIASTIDIYRQPDARQFSSAI